MTLRLEIANPDAPLTQGLGGKVLGARPGAMVDATCRLTDDAGQIWQAEVRFAANAAGEVDFAHTPSLAGTYVGSDAHGLLWSGLPTGAETYLGDILAGRSATLMPALDPLAPLRFELKVQSGQNSVETTVTRRRLLEDVHTEPPPEPLHGLFFRPAQPNGAAVLVLGGSEGGLFPARAALLAASGFTTLALAYFAHPGRPAEGRNLPLEYFREALTWLGAQTGVSRVGLIGVSRGSEAAQLTALAWPDLVNALVAWVPSSMINRGLDLEGGADFRREVSAMWARDGVSINGIGFLETDIEATAQRDRDFATPGGRRYREEFLRAWQQPGAEAFRIPVEDYKGPVLAIGGSDDALWPSDLGAELIAEASRNSNSASEAIVYPNAGHLIGTPNEPRPFPFVMHWSDGYMGIDNGFCAYGGTREGAALAARQSWHAQIEFLHTHLCN